MLSVAALKRILFGLVAIGALALVGCAGGGGGGGLPNPTIRYFNGSPDSTSLNFLLDDAVEASQLAYLESTPDFESVQARIRDLRVQEDGSSIDLWSEVVDLQKDRHYLVSAVGIENFGSEPLKRLRLLFTELDRTAPNGTRARLLIVHGYNRAAGLETPPIDFQTPGDNPQFRVSDIAYANTATLEVDAGNWTFEARRQGTQTILVQQNITLEGGKIYAAYVLGIENGLGQHTPRIEFVELQSD
jgi:hypothetical protein